VGGAQGRYTALDDTNNVLNYSELTKYYYTTQYTVHSTHPSPDDGSAIRETDFGRE